MSEGAQISYRLRLRGLPLHWKTLMARWQPPHAFVDVQLHGPYALWQHTHTFEPVAGDAVRIRDEVLYVLPFAPFGNLASGFVERDVRSIFTYRERIIAEKFGSVAGFMTEPSRARRSDRSA